jgi:hypothetical protein
MPEREFKRNITATTSSEYSEKLSYLEEKINAIRKDISYFDAYNITQGISDKNQLSAAIAALPPGSALVVNFQDTYKLGGREYKTGDVVLRTINGEEVYISSQVGGTYYPYQLTKDGSDDTYKLTFKYIESKPTAGQAGITSGKDDKGNDTWTATIPTQEIAFPVQTAAEAIGGAYSRECLFKFNNTNNKVIPQGDELNTTPNQYEFPQSSVDDCLIQPLVRFIIKDDDDKMVEELELEYALSKNEEDEK